MQRRHWSKLGESFRFRQDHPSRVLNLCDSALSLWSGTFIFPGIYTFIFQMHTFMEWHIRKKTSPHSLLTFSPSLPVLLKTGCKMSWYSWFVIEKCQAAKGWEVKNRLAFNSKLLLTLCCWRRNDGGWTGHLVGPVGLFICDQNTPHYWEVWLGTLQKYPIESAAL